MAPNEPNGVGPLLKRTLRTSVSMEWLRVALDASDAVAKSGDDEEVDEVEPVDTVGLSGLRGSIYTWPTTSSLTDGRFL